MIIATEVIPLQVLLCEDSPGDVRLTREAFLSANKSVNLHVATDGVEAIAFLKGEGDYVYCPRPDLILLDLNMPRMDGRETSIREFDSDQMLTRDFSLRKARTHHRAPFTHVRDGTIML